MRRSPINKVSPLPVVIEIAERFRSHYKPFRARVRWPDGAARTMVVKPQRSEYRGTLEHLFSEWCGYTLAHSLGLPTPEAHIVDVPEGSLRPLGSAYADVTPGVAFATEYQAGYIRSGDLGFPRNFRNIDSLSGMVVLDTVLSNNDREHDVLAVPIPGTSQFELRYIDNTWLVYDREPTEADIVGRFPSDSALRWLARGLPGLDPFLLAARTLNTSALDEAFRAAPPEFLAAAPATTDVLAATFTWRGAHSHDAINRDIPPDMDISPQRRGS